MLFAAAASMAALCGFQYSPAASWDAIPLPADAQVIEIPLSQIAAQCFQRPPGVDIHTGRRHVVYGCAMVTSPVAYIPTPATWPGTPQCWREIKRHEESHLKGWTHPE